MKNLSQLPPSSDLPEMSFIDNSSGSSKKLVVVPASSKNYGDYNFSVDAVAGVYKDHLGAVLAEPLDLTQSVGNGGASPTAYEIFENHARRNGYDAFDGSCKVRLVLPSFAGLDFYNSLQRACGPLDIGATLLSDAFIAGSLPGGSTVIAPKSELGLFKKANKGKKLDLIASDIMHGPSAADMLARLNDFVGANKDVAKSIIYSNIKKVAFVGGRARDEYGRYAEMTPDIMKKAAADIMKWAKGQSLLVVTNDKHGFVDASGPAIEPYQALEAEFFARQQARQKLYIFGRGNDRRPEFVESDINPASNGGARVLRTPLALDASGKQIGSPYYFAMHEALHDEMKLLFTADQMTARAEYGAMLDSVMADPSNRGRRNDMLSKLDYLPWALTGGSPATFRAHRKAWENIKRKDIWDKPLFTAADALRRHLEEAELPLVHPNFREHFPWLAAALVGSNR